MKTKKIFLAVLFLGFALFLASCEQHAHTFATEWSKDNDYHWHAATCEHTTEVNDKAEHSWDLGEITKQPTEEEYGEKTFKCSVCEATKIEQVEKLAHTHKFSDEWTSNNTHHWHASTCGHDVKDGEAEHDWNNGVETLAPTEEEFGKMLYTCQTCEATKEEQIDKLPHTHKYQDTYSFDDDYHWYGSACGHEDEVTGLAEHDWNDGVVTKNPTCQENGVKTFTCTVCGHTKEEPVAKDMNAHLFAPEWTSNDTHHWHASTCGHDVKDGEEEHIWGEGVASPDSTYYEEGKMIYTCTVCEKTKEEVIPVKKNYENANWTSKIENGYYFLDGKVYSDVYKPLNTGDDAPWFRHDEENHVLYNTQQGQNYTINVDIKGLVSTLNHDTLYAGVVVWYQDADNYLVLGMHWAAKERPGDIRSIALKGRINGDDYSSGDDWCDNSALLPAHGVTLEITKLRDTFAYVAKKSDGTRIKNGQFKVAGTDTSNAYVGLIGMNDTFEFSDFVVEEYIPAPTVYTATVNNVEHKLELSNLNNSFVLKVGSEQSTGTYLKEGYNVTLTFADESVKVVTVANDGSFVYAEVEDEEGVVKVADGAVVEIATEQTGDYEWSFHVDGNATSIGGEIYYRFYIWYLDADNNAEVRIFWNPSDRSYEMNKLQLWVNGHEATNHWGDNPHNNTLPADGFDVSVVKSAGAFAVTIKAKTATYKFNYTPSNFNADATYSVCAGAANDSYKLKDVVFTEIAAAKTQTYTNVSNAQEKLELEINGNGCKLITASGEQTGTYTAEGGFIYLTLGEETVKVRLIGQTFAIVVEQNDSEAIVIEAGKSAVLAPCLTGDYEMSMDVVGTISSAVTSEVKYRFLAWYLDDNNYAEIFVEWQQWDRSFEIRSIQVRTVTNGVERKEIITIWGDNPNNNTLPADGFTLTVKKTGNKFAIKLVTKLTNITKQGSVTLPELSDLEAAYAVKVVALGDTFTVSNVKF